MTVHAVQVPKVIAELQERTRQQPLLHPLQVQCAALTAAAVAAAATGVQQSVQ